MGAARDQGAVSLATAAAAFVVVGGAIVVCAILDHVEPHVLKFALGAYLAIAVPLLIAGAIGTKTTKRGHRSFRLSPLPYMEGRRVKRRLLWIAYPAYLVGCLVGLTTMVLGFVAVVHFWPQAGQFLRDRFWGAFPFMASAVVAYCLTMLGLKVIFVRLGWMTREEARPFPFRMRRHRWPDSWLEPTDEGESAERAEVK